MTSGSMVAGGGDLTSRSGVILREPIEHPLDLLKIPVFLRGFVLQARREGVFPSACATSARSQASAAFSARERAAAARARLR